MDAHDTDRADPDLDQNDPEQTAEKVERLTVAEAALQFGVNERTIRKRIQAGELEERIERRYGKNVKTVDPRDVARFWPMKAGADTRAPRTTRDMGREKGPDQSEPQVEGVPDEEHRAVVAERDQLQGRVDLLGEQLQGEKQGAATLALELGKVQGQVAQLTDGSGGEVRPIPARRTGLATAGFGLVAIAAVAGAAWFGGVRKDAERAQVVAAHAEELAGKEKTHTTEVAGLQGQITDAQAGELEAKRATLEADTAKANAELQLERTSAERDRLAEELAQARRVRVLLEAEGLILRALFGAH